MKVKPIYIFIALLVILSVSLFGLRGASIHKDLVRIDSIAVNNPSRALEELNSLKTKPFSDKDQAYYTIIESQAQMDLGYFAPSDSLLNVSIFSYLGSDDSSKISRIYYLRGRWLLHDGSMLEAASSLMYASDYVSSDLADVYKYQIYSSLGDLCHQNKLHQNELEVRQKALTFARLYGDSLAIHNSSVALHRCSSLVSTFSADIIQQVLRMMYALPASELYNLPESVRKLTSQEEYKTQLRAAVNFVDSAIVCCDDPTKMLSYLRVRGELLYLKGKYSDAIRHFKQALNSPVDNDQMAALQGLYEIYKNRKQQDSAYYYADRLFLIQDSIRREWSDGALVRLNSIQAYKKQRRAFLENKIEVFHTKSILSTISIGFLITILVLLLLLGMYRNNQVHLKMSVEEERNKLIETELEKRRIENELLREQADKENERLKTMALELQRKETENELLKEKTEKEALLARDLLIKAEYYKRLNLISIPILSAKKDKKGFIFLSMKEWEIIKSNTNACFENFTDRLVAQFPQLSEDDIHFLCLIKMELSLELLASVYHVEKNSISKKKGRMREKLKIQNKTLDEFIRLF
ncbi:MAG: hypothetical protein ACRC9Q_07875 [Bacteroidales bacterium]